MNVVGADRRVIELARHREDRALHPLTARAPPILVRLPLPPQLLCILRREAPHVVHPRANVAADELAAIAAEEALVLLAVLRARFRRRRAPLLPDLWRLRRERLPLRCSERRAVGGGESGGFAMDPLLGALLVADEQARRRLHLHHRRHAVHADPRADRELLAGDHASRCQQTRRSGVCVWSLLSVWLVMMKGSDHRSRKEQRSTPQHKRNRRGGRSKKQAAPPLRRAPFRLHPAALLAAASHRRLMSS